MTTKNFERAKFIDERIKRLNEAHKNLEDTISTWKATEQEKEEFRLIIKEGFKKKIEGYQTEFEQL